MMDKAARALALTDGVVQDTEHPEVWRVRSINGPRRYRVQTYPSGFTTCTCLHGMNNQGDAHCYHVEAVERQLKLNREKPIEVDFSEVREAPLGRTEYPDLY